jgi:cellulose synthase/poly-beta-1,6-N-acetylglucosamine synthase-like glycosyltransferase
MIDTILLVLAAFTLMLCSLTAIRLVLGLRQTRRLVDCQLANGRLPNLSIIVPARNEERHIEAALRSLLQLDYPDLEILVVDDRSTDRTGEILDRIAREYPRLNVVHVTELPHGWLGKNHALYHGAQRARGEFLLFTDADVTMAPDTLRRAVGYALENGLDHLAVTPEVVMPTLLLQSFAVVFVTLFSIYFEPWKARNPKSKRYIGIGAFNLIRRDVYQKIGTHEAIRMRPDDDMMLGKLVKKHGFAQDATSGVGLISVPWYGTLREVVVGLEKNAFSGVEYRISVVVVSSAMILLFDVWPFAAVWVTRGATQWLNAATVAVLLALCWRAAAWIRLPRRAVIGFPLAILFFVYVQWRAMYLTLRYRGIRWRDTHYSLDELKANRV